MVVTIEIIDEYGCWINFLAVPSKVRSFSGKDDWIMMEETVVKWDSSFQRRISRKNFYTLFEFVIIYEMCTSFQVILLFPHIEITLPLTF